MLHRRTPISTYLARDVGAWAAIMSVVHAIAGLFVHGPPAPLVQRILFYYFAPNGAPLINYWLGKLDGTSCHNDRGGVARDFQ